MTHPDIERTHHMTGTTMDGAAFARSVVERVAEFCRGYVGRLPAYSYVPLETDAQRIRVMQSRLFNEVRSAEIFGSWLKTTPELEVKMALGGAIAEEMGHARLLSQRIAEHGGDPYAYRPVPGQMAMFNAFEATPTTVERIAAFSLAGEGVAEFMIERALEAPGVPEWIKAPYRAISSEEEEHAHFPEEVIARYATTAEAQDRVRRAIAMSLTLRAQYFADLDDWVFREAAW
jgi:1,2-phenylacetyl-CoA epoxidase catalytic subunit